MFKYLLLLIPLWAQAMVIGKDSRILMPAFRGLPYSAVGVVEAAGMRCTGVLVKKDVVLTAAHCVVRSGQKLPTDLIEYRPQYEHGVGLGEDSRVIDVVVSSAGVRGERHGDWALLKLNKNLGDIYGTIGIRALKKDEMHKAVLTVLGYDTTHEITKNYGLSLLVNTVKAHPKEIPTTGVLSHTAPTGPGVSGAPLMIGDKLVAITVSEAARGSCRSFNRLNCYNLAVMESEWRAALSNF